MKKLLEKNMELFTSFCLKNNISAQKALNMPKCYSSEEMYIQTYDESKAIHGLRNNEPADTLLIIRRNGDGIDFSLTEKGKEILSI